MATAIWPPLLPQNILVNGYNETMANDLVVANFDIGPPQTRRRSIGAPVPLQGTITATIAEVALFKEFYNDTLIGGSQRFSWKQPVSQDAVLMMFSPETQPTITAVGGTNFRIAMSLLMFEDTPIT